MNPPTLPFPFASIDATPSRKPAEVSRPRARHKAAIWTVRTEIQAADESIAAACGISPVTAAILRHRGHEGAEAVRAFLQPERSLLHDPRTLPDIELAVERLRKAICAGEKLLVFGDYDVDGITSTALLVRSLRALGANLDYRLPERHEGYGLSERIVEESAEAGVALILTADCGITARPAARRARELGVDLIITDHHDVPDELPDALAVVNPKRPDSEYGFHELSGCGVAYKVVQALLMEHWPRHVASFEEKFVDLVGLAAIADCVSLTGENRYLAYQGLRELRYSRRRGIQALMRVSDLRATGDSLQGHHVSFRLAPRLNAAGRLASPRLALELLLSNDDAECENLARRLEELNRERQSHTRTATLEAAAVIEQEANLDRDCLLVAARGHWPKGVVGLIASKLVESYHRPAFAMTIHDGVAHGSGRSVADFDLSGLVDATRGLLLSGGGHAAACGLSLEADKLPEFSAAAREYAATQLKVEELVPRLEADVEVRPSHVTSQLVEDLQRLEPCGTGNAPASLLLRGARLMESRSLGASGEHVRWRLDASGRQLEAIWWRGGERAADFALREPLDIMFVPELNTYNGRTTVQLTVKDARPS